MWSFPFSEVFAAQLPLEDRFGMVSASRAGFIPPLTQRPLTNGVRSRASLPAMHVVSDIVHRRVKQETAKGLVLQREHQLVLFTYESRNLDNLPLHRACMIDECECGRIPSHAGRLPCTIFLVYIKIQ